MVALGTSWRNLFAQTNVVHPTSSGVAQAGARAFSSVGPGLSAFQQALSLQTPHVLSQQTLESILSRPFRHIGGASNKLEVSETQAVSVDVAHTRPSRSRISGQQWLLPPGRLAQPADFSHTPHHFGQHASPPPRCVYFKPLAQDAAAGINQRLKHAAARSIRWRNGGSHGRDSDDPEADVYHG